MMSKVSIADVLREGFEATKKNANSVLVFFIGIYAAIFLLSTLTGLAFLNILMVPAMALMQMVLLRTFKSPVSKFEVNDITHSNAPDFKDKLLWLSVYMLGWGIIIGLLFLLLIIPGVIFMVYWYMASYIFLEHKTSFTASLSKSKEMIKGRWLKTFLLLLVMGIISIVLQGIVSGLGGANTLVGGLLVSIVSGVTSVYFGYVTVAYYFSLKK